ncbi:MAG: glycosyltransferase family 2 protein [Acetobacteraceae bacterium]|nr:glycosyltransferase family 2 protein [Acetobacteraceae bacterium]
MGGGIDIIVPCYGYGHYLPECIESVLQERKRDIRILIIDDASPDETAEVAAALAEKDRRIAWRRHTANRGHIATYNEGLEWASAEYTLLLSADDLVLPGALSRAAELLDTHPEVGFAYGPFIRLRDGDPRPPELDLPPVPGWTILSSAEFFRSNRPLNIVGTCTAVVRTKLQKIIGGYRPELPHAGDMEMWMRFAAHGPVGRLNTYQGIYRWHPRAMSETYYDKIILDLRQRKAAVDLVFEKYGDRIPEAEELRNYLHKGLAEYAIWCTSEPFERGDLENFDVLLEFATSTCPALRRSLNWKLLQVKRMLGPRLWSTILPARRLATAYRVS